MKRKNVSYVFLSSIRMSIQIIDKIVQLEVHSSSFIPVEKLHSTMRFRTFIFILIFLSFSIVSIESYDEKKHVSTKNISEEFSSRGE